MTILRRSALAACRLSNGISSPAAARSIISTGFRCKDLLAKYRPPQETSSQSSGKSLTLDDGEDDDHTRGQGSTSRDITFGTVSTTPVGTSFQEVPKPGTLLDKGGVKSALPLPAMMSVESSGDASTKPARDWRETRDPLSILGVTVPPKPRAPGEEGMCSF